LPWKEKAGYIYAPGPNGANICAVSELRATTTLGYTPFEIGSPDSDEIFANAAFILTAVNSHHALIAENKAAYQRIDELEKALNGILSANDEFRAGMPDEWEGDLLQDACNDARELVPLVSPSAPQSDEVMG
jgi:hypothetical protein